MRRLLFSAACLLTLGMAYRYRCGWTHATKTKRDPATGARRCWCGRAYADLQDSGELYGSGYVLPMKSGAFVSEKAKGTVTEVRH